MTLKDLLNEIRSGCSKHDQAIMLITACLESGIDTRKGIVDALVELGFDYQHVAITLNENAGMNPELHRWRRDENATII